MANSGSKTNSKEGGDKVTKGAGYYHRCWWNEKKIVMQLTDLLGMKDKIIADLKDQIRNLSKGGKNG